MQALNFLRTVLKLDAASCLGLGAVMLPMAASLSAPFGIEASVLRGAAISLIPIGLFVLWLGTRREIPAALVALLIAGNFAWSAASLVAASAIPAMTPLGQAAVIAQALAVLGLAIAEWAGLRASQKAAVAAV